MAANEAFFWSGFIPGIKNEFYREKMKNELRQHFAFDAHFKEQEHVGEGNHGRNIYIAGNFPREIQTLTLAGAIKRGRKGGNILNTCNFLPSVQNYTICGAKIKLFC